MRTKRGGGTFGTRQWWQGTHTHMENYLLSQGDLISLSDGPCIATKDIVE